MLQTSLMRSPILNTDSYKPSQFLQLPPGIEKMYSYIESRGGRYPETLVFGIQSVIKNFLLAPITREQIDFAEKFWPAHGEPFNKEGWEYILKEYDGRLPLKIRSVKEGTLLPVKNVIATVENTDPKCAWLVSYVETLLLRGIWYPTTVATNSFMIKRILKKYLDKSGDVSGLGFKLHDFGFRGVSSFESAGIGAMAHLVNFMGTDTVAGIFQAVNDYSADPFNTAFSIPASEHSSITSWTRPREKEAYLNMIKTSAKPGGILACVSDSYDIYEACRIWVSLKEEIIASGATLVIRPDSGDPIEVLPKMLKILESGFGAPKNDKGYKVLNTVRIIWGDGISENSITTILRTVVDVMGFSADNLAFGMGGALLGAPQRDDQKFAMKASAALINGKWVEVFKDPITDLGKVSKKGRVTTYKNEDGYYTAQVDKDEFDELQTVFIDGKLINEAAFFEIRERTMKYL